MLDHILSETDANEFQSLLDKSQNIILTCHVSPDGDALGSVLAMAHFLWRKGKNAIPVVPNIFPDFLKWMPGAQRVLIYDKNADTANPLIEAADLIVCLDFNEPERLLKMQEAVIQAQAEKVMIDHHIGPAEFCKWKESRPEMSSTCELLYRILDQIDGDGQLTYEEAVCLYTGMMTDTGCFSYNSNRSDIYYIVARLLEKGIDKDKIYRNVCYNYPADRFSLLGFLLYVKLEVFPEYRATLMTLTREELKRFVSKKGITEGFVNIPLQIAGTRLSVFLREDTERPVIRVSLRSVDDFPCNEMAAEFFNGGGHLNAAGGELACSMVDATLIVRKALRKYAPLLAPAETPTTVE